MMDAHNVWAGVGILSLVVWVGLLWKISDESPTSGEVPLMMLGGAVGAWLMLCYTKATAIIIALP